ncbi:signal-transducing adaptor protein 1-like [Protopterus annectens]|uniref:signal-transducing adaptor protein 1-like n=1 Tax=Protopterus annectens TaxID=7888 RepID=UPI001CFB709B|nr:signal-transducing adaptor protein 1-like [Protopterus annectens]
MARARKIGEGRTIRVADAVPVESSGIFDIFGENFACGTVELADEVHNSGALNYIVENTVFEAGEALLDAEYVVQNVGLDESDSGINIAGRNINNLRYMDDPTIRTESEKEFKSLLIKEFRSYWAELRGTTLFFYSASKDATYAERLDLLDLIPAAVDRSQNSQVLKFTHRVGNEEIHLKADNADASILWTSYIETVLRLELPRMFSLLPGQILRLQEIIEQERARRTSVPLKRQTTITQEEEQQEYDDIITRMPLCFFPVSRQEATDMLEKNPEYGSLILRPGNDSQNFSITISFPTMKHYKVSRTPGGYVIQLEKQITFNSLDEVIQHFVNETRGNLKPYIQRDDYSTTIEFPSPSATDIKERKAGIPRAAVAPYVHTPAPPPPPPAPAQWATKRSSSVAKPEDDYLNEDDLDELNKMNLKDNQPPVRAVPTPSPRAIIDNQPPVRAVPTPVLVRS